MISFPLKPKKRRGNNTGRAMPNTAGGATSAAKMAGRSGVRAASSLFMWIPGEGHVRWTEIEQQVGAAFSDWRMRRALAGKKTWDAWEARQADIAEAVAKRRPPHSQILSPVS